MSGGTTHSTGNHDRPISEWFSPARFAFILGALILLSFAPVVIGWQSFYIRDFGYFGYPLAAYHRESFWRGEIPLWNPLSSNGLPFLAQWNTLVLYPGSLIYLLLPLPWSLNLFCLMHLFIGGMGAYFLARRWTNDGLAASVAGMAFAFNGLTLNCLMWPNNIAALGLMPWVVLLTERACAGGGRKIVLAALVGASDILSGAPEILLLTWLFTGAMLIGQPIWGADQWRQRLHLLSRFTGVVLLVSGLVAVQLLPFADLLKFSHRDQNTADTIAWSMPIWGWANFLVPLFRCKASGVGVFFQIGQDWTSSYYLGIGTLALALAGAACVRSRRSWLLAAMLGFSLLMALGPDGHVYTWVRKVIPQFGLIRFSIKFVVLALFCVPFLAAFAIHHQNGLTDPIQLSGWRRWLLGVAIGFAIAAIAIVWMAYHRQLPLEPNSASWQHGVGRIVILGLTIGTVLNLRRWALSRAPWLPGVALLMLVWLDAWTHMPSQNPTIKPDAFATDIARGQWKQHEFTLEPAPGGLRAWTPRYAYEPLLRTMSPEPDKDFLVHRLALFANCNLLENAPIVDSFFSLHLSQQRDLWSLLYFASSTTNAARVLDLVGAGAISSPKNIFEWEPRTNALPFASIGQMPRFATPDDTLTALTKKDYDCRAVVYLPTNAVTVITATNPATAEITTQQFSTHRIDLETSSSAPAMVHLSQSFYHPWQAYIDGQPATIWRANHAFQAVEVPAGKHQLRLIYEDQRFHLGSIISLASLLICAGLWMFWRTPKELTL